MSPIADLTQAAADLIQSAADWLFVPLLVIVLFGTGLFMTARLGVVQVRRFGEALRGFFGGRGSGEGALTPFQTFMTALAATIGTGNIAGVAAGIVSGGPGVLFWIWCYGFFATSIKFAEAVLGLTFRQARGQDVQSGPMYYLRDGLRSPALAMIYAVVAGIAALTTTPFTQTNSIALVMNTQIGVPLWVSGVVIAVLTWLVIIGGIKSIGRAAEKLSPLKVGLYLVGSLIVIVTFASNIPERSGDGLSRSVHDAIGAGVWRVHGDAIRARTRSVCERGRVRDSGRRVRHGAERQAVTTGPQCGDGSLSRLVRNLHADGAHDAARNRRDRWTSGQTGHQPRVALAFDAAMPGFGGYVVAFCVFLFGYTTLIGWAFYGEQFLSTGSDDAW